MSDLPSRPNPKDLLKLSKADANGEKLVSSAEDSGVDKSNGAAPCKVIKHVPTECSCGKNGEHYPSVALDEIYTGTLETINNLLYNSGFTKKFLLEKEKCTGKSNIYNCVLLVEYVVLTHRSARFRCKYRKLGEGTRRWQVHPRIQLYQVFGWLYR